MRRPVSPARRTANRPTRATVRAALGALAVLATAARLPAQAVVGDVPLLPAAAGLNPAGLGPVVIDPAAAFIYVLSSRGLTVIDRGAGDTFTNFEIGPTATTMPADLVFDPVCRRVYVADEGQRLVVVVDAGTRTILARVPLARDVFGLALDTSRNRLYAIGRTSGDVVSVDTTTLAVAGSAPLPNPGSAIAVNPTNGKVYVTDSVDGATYRFTAGLAAGATLATGMGSSALAVDPTAGKVYVLTTGGATVVDSATDGVLATKAITGATLVVANPTTGWAYVVANDPGAPPATPPSASVVGIDPAGATTSTPIGASPDATAGTQLAIDPVAGRLFVSDSIQLTRCRVNLFDVASGSAVRTGQALPGTNDAAGMAWSPFTGRLYVPSVTNAIAELIPPSLITTIFTVGTTLTAGPVNEGAGTAYAIDAAGNRVATITLAGIPAAPTAVAAVGQLPFQAERGNPAADELYVVDQNSKDIAVLRASTGAVLRTKTGVPGDITSGFAVDTNGGVGPTKGYLANPVVALALPAPSYLQVFKPASGDTLTGINPACTFPSFSNCILPLALGVNETTHRLYASILDVDVLGGPAASAGVAAFRTDTDVYVAKRVFATGDFPSLLLEVDPINDRVFTGVSNGGAWRVVSLAGGTLAPTDLPLAGVPTDFSLRTATNRLYVAEPGSGQIEVVDTAASTLLAPLAVGGQPRRVQVQPGRAILWVADAAGPSVRVIDPAGGTMATMSDLDFRFIGGAAAGVTFDLGEAFAATSVGRVTFMDTRHGMVAVLDPVAPPLDFQIAGIDLPAGTTTAPYDQTLTASGGVGSSVYEVTSGTLPPGLALALDGHITGTPAREGIYSFMVRATSTGAVPPILDVEDFQIQVLNLRLVTKSLPSALSCGTYAVGMLAAGGVPPYTWSAAGLPAWASIDPATGVISGSPGAPAACPPSVDVSVRDAAGTIVTLPFCLEVLPGAVPAAVGNALLAVKSASFADVVLSWAYGGGSVDGFNVYRASAKIAIPGTRIPPGGPLPPSTAGATYTDAGEVPPTTSIQWYYGLRAVSACGESVE